MTHSETILLLFSVGLYLTWPFRTLLQKSRNSWWLVGWLGFNGTLSTQVGQWRV